MIFQFEPLLVVLGLRKGDPVAQTRAKLLRWAQAHETSNPSHAADLRAVAMASSDRDPP